MPKPVPRAFELGRCPLRDRHGEPQARWRHLIWRHETGWVVAFGTPRVWELVTAGLPCWHLAKDAAARKWHRPDLATGDPGGWASVGFRVNAPLTLPSGETVCDVCYADLAGGVR